MLRLAQSSDPVDDQKDLAGKPDCLASLPDGVLQIGVAIVADIDQPALALPDEVVQERAYPPDALRLAGELSHLVAVDIQLGWKVK